MTMTKTERNARSQIAWHEAGHAVTARALGVDIRYATATLDHAGVQTHSVAWANRDADIATRINAFETDAMVALAGMLAQERYLREHPQAKRVGLPEEQEDDNTNIGGALTNAAYLAAGLPLPNLRPGEKMEIELTDDLRKDVEARYERLWEATDNLLIERWHIVRRVAKTLERRDGIDQAELDRVIAVAQKTQRET